MFGVCDTREWTFNEALLFKITSFYGNEWVSGQMGPHGWLQFCSKTLLSKDKMQIPSFWLLQIQTGTTTPLPDESKLVNLNLSTLFQSYLMRWLGHRLFSSEANLWLLLLY